MAPKHKKEKRAEEDVFTLEAEGTVEAKKEEELNLSDSTALKRALDEAVVEAVTEAGHHPDNTYTDLKIALGLLACGLACLAQFYPKKYPDNFWVLVGCVSGYVVLSLLMSVVAIVWEKETILFTKEGSGSGSATHPPLAISSKMPRFDDTYTLQIALRRGAVAPAAGSKAGSGGGSGVTLAKSVGAYFHDDGYLAKDVIKADARQLLQQLIEAKTK